MIKINNIQKSYSYPLIQLRGCVHRSIKCDKILISVNSDVTDWPVIDSNFKFLVHLRKGSNEVVVWLQSEPKLKSKQKFTLKLEPISNNNFVKIVYLVCDSGSGQLFDNGSFQAPQTEDNSIGSAIKRISFNMLCSQCFFAQTLPNQKTFNLELGENNYPEVHVFKLSATVEKIWSMDGPSLWRLVAKQLMTSTLADDHCKYIAFSSFTRYSRSDFESLSNPLRHVKGYSALGGGRLALVGTACLYTWASSLRELRNRFEDSRLVDRNLLMDDSNNRGFLWSCYSTTLGAMIHELGHVFDLGHSHSGIMAFQFHNVKSFFILEPNEGKESKWWTSSQLSLLHHHKWLNNINDCQSESSFTIKRNLIKSKFGIVCVEYRESEKEMTLKSRVFTLAVKFLQLETFCDAIAFIMDTKGNTIKVNL